MNPKCITRIIERNLRNLHEENPVMGDESELTKIGRILILLSGLLSIKDDCIILHQHKSGDTILTHRDTIIFLHTKVYPVLVSLFEKVDMDDTEASETPSSYTCIYHLKQYLKNTDETKRFLRVAREFFADESA
jgi:hypothetical protein